MEGYGARLTLEQRERYCGPDGLEVQDREQFEIFINCKNLRNSHGRDTDRAFIQCQSSPSQSLSWLLFSFIYGS
ncbi:hypothetical protein SAMN05216412_106117 [Nitrosospira multiformis]|uniref:Uncharacterized protein n=1 Tax=Nitrosospira multiformis TaxID=1231 RepID=A0A1I0ECT6_9PROT|nr:hypothetical protein SAMN05216412_106117 [Nitrosospira multiformis]